MATTIAADTSSYGLGVVLLQRQEDSQDRPVAIAFRSISETEQRYAQVEKEALAITWVCEKFADYLICLTFKGETDNTPLVPLLGNKRLDDILPRLQSFRMRLMRLTYSIAHVLSENLITADALSRAPMQELNRAEEHFTLEVEAYFSCVVASLPATDRRLQRYGPNRKKMRFVRKLWPSEQTNGKTSSDSAQS